MKPFPSLSNIAKAFLSASSGSIPVKNEKKRYMYQQIVPKYTVNMIRFKQITVEKVFKKI